MHTPSPTALQCCLAPGRAAAHQPPWSPRPPPRDCCSLAQSQGQRVCSVPCSEHTGTLRPRERKPLGMHLLGLTHPPPTLVHFLVQENPAHPPLGPALAGGGTLPAVAFKSSRSSPALHPTVQRQMSAALTTRTLVRHFTRSSGPRQKWPPTHGRHP